MALYLARGGVGGSGDGSFSKRKTKLWISTLLQVTRNVMTAILSLPPGDIYNLSVTACTERGSNTSMLRLIKLGNE